MCWERNPRSQSFLVTLGPGPKGASDYPLKTILQVMQLRPGERQPLEPGHSVPGPCPYQAHSLATPPPCHLQPQSLQSQEEVAQPLQQGGDHRPPLSAGSPLSALTSDLQKLRDWTPVCDSPSSALNTPPRTQDGTHCPDSLLRRPPSAEGGAGRSGWRFRQAGTPTLRSRRISARTD